MDVDLLNTPTDAQMELMSMMIQMEKLTEFSEPPPSLGFSNNPTRSFYNPATHDPLLDPILSHPTEMSLSIDPSSERRASVAAMREMIFRMAAMQPIHIDPESVKPPKRRNVRISKDPQSVAARHRRERISERIRILQRLVPGGTKMDTASMLDEAIHYVKFLKSQVQSLERVAASRGAGFSPADGTFSGGNYMCFGAVDQGFISSGQMMS